MSTSTVPASFTRGARFPVVFCPRAEAHTILITIAFSLWVDAGYERSRSTLQGKASDCRHLLSTCGWGGAALGDKVIFWRDSSGLRETVSHFREGSQFCGVVRSQHARSKAPAKITRFNAGYVETSFGA